MSYEVCRTWSLNALMSFINTFLDHRERRGCKQMEPEYWLNLFALSAFFAVVSLSCPVRSLHQPIPVVPLTRLVAEVLDEPLHVRHAHAESRAGLRDNVLLNHNAAQIIRAELKRDLADVQALGDPRALNIRNVLQVNPAERLHPQILVCADRRRFESGVLRLKGPGDERGEAGRM